MELVNHGSVRLFRDGARNLRKRGCRLADRRQSPCRRRDCRTPGYRRCAARCPVRSRKLRSCRGVPALSHRNQASPAGVRQCSIGDHGVSQAADVAQCAVHRDLAIGVTLAEILRLPTLRFSAAELQHGPRAALSSKTPVIVLRLMDETAAMVDAVASELRERKIALHLCGGPRSTLPWLGDDDPTTDGITMLVPAYRLIERIAREWGFDPDRPPQLSKVTETF